MSAYNALTMAAGSKIVPVRLTCRFSNGLVMSYTGRVLDYEGGILRVLTNESLDVGVPVTAITPVLSGPTTCRVRRAERSPELPGYFVVELRALQKPKAPPLHVPEAMRAAALELAARLVRGGPRCTLAQALAGMDPPQTLACLQATAAAVLLLVHAKGLADPVPLLRAAGGRR